MKKEFFVFFIVLAIALNAQVGINTENPDASSVLDIESNNKGVLFPRMTKEQRDKIEKPAKGLMIYNMTDDTVDVNIGTPEAKKWKSLIFHDSGEPAVQPSEVIVGNPDSGMAGIGFPVFFTEGSYEGSWSAVLYDKSNFTGKSGKITKVSYLIKPNYRNSKVGECSTDRQRIYMRWVDDNYFSNGDKEDNESLKNNYTKVFDGTVIWKKETDNNKSWTEISLTEQFPLEENKQLIIYYVNDHPGRDEGGYKCLRNRPGGDVTLPVFVLGEDNKNFTKSQPYTMTGEKTSTKYPVTKFNFN